LQAFGAQMGFVPPKNFSWRPYTYSLHHVNIHLQWRDLWFGPGEAKLSWRGTTGHRRKPTRQNSEKS